MIKTYYFRAEKEKAKFQQEMFELLAQVESANKDRVYLFTSMAHIHFLRNGDYV